MYDEKVIDLCYKLNCSVDSFDDETCYRNVVTLLKSYAPSTAENYIWRLHRCLTSTPGFPPKMLKKYHTLLLQYKKLYK